MKKANYISKLTNRMASEKTGNKAQSLIFLQRNKYRIPLTYVLSADAYNDYLKVGEPVIEELKKEIAGLPELTYAIRSSTSMEDSENYSFAGQFQTVTDVSGADNILKAVQSVWNSTRSVNRSEYDARTSSTCNDLKCGVIIQQMVNAQLAGVSFSKNPVTGLNETIIEAVEGPGETLVQNGATPKRWRIKGKSIIEGDAEYTSIDVINEIAEDTLRIKHKFGHHVDIEWAYDGKTLYYLQVRSITGNCNIPIYSNKLAQEMLPGQVKPLVWSVNIPLVNGTWIRILSEITGNLNIQPEELAKTFYYRFYLNMDALDRIFSKFGLPAESLESMMGSKDKTHKPKYKPGLTIFRHTFRMIRFVITKMNFEKTILSDYNSLKTSYESLAIKIRTNFSSDTFNDLYMELFKEGQKIAYLNIIVPLLMRMYNNQFSKKLSRLGADYNQLDFNEDFPALTSLSPIGDMERIRQQVEKLPEEIREKCISAEALADIDETKSIAAEFHRFINNFGHLSESGTDFSVPKWEEDHEFVFRMIMDTAAPVSQVKKFRFRDLKYSKLRYPRLNKLYLKSGRFKIYREQISSLYILGYGQFRTLFLLLGREFSTKGLLEKSEDIFYLRLQEIKDVQAGNLSDFIPGYSRVVRERKREMEETKDLILPSVIIGDQAPILEKGNATNYKGIGTSSGIFSGKSTVIRGTGDFKAVKRGDVLFIPFSDVSWSPVLVQAGAIVSESGGMLSHCSIIARELGIPAVVSVENACSLGNDLSVTVDGSNGILTIHDHE